MSMARISHITSTARHTAKRRPLWRRQHICKVRRDICGIQGWGWVFCVCLVPQHRQECITGSTSRPIFPPSAAAFLLCILAHTFCYSEMLHYRLTLTLACVSTWPLHSNVISRARYDHSRYIQIVWKRYAPGMSDLCLTNADGMCRDFLNQF